MKTRILPIIIFLIFTSVNLVAQPLPPTNPSGNPVPVGNIAGLILLVGGIFLVKRKKN